MLPDLDTSAPARHLLADELDVVRDRVLAGPNRWRREPAITGDVVTGALAARPALLAAALERLRAGLPALAEAGPPRTDATVAGTRDPGTPATSAADGRAWADAVAALALALQRAAGADVGPWRIVAPGDEPGSWAFAIGYEDEAAGMASVREAARLLRHAVRGDDLALAEAIDDLRDRRRRDALDPTTAAIVAEARRRGIPVRRTPGERVVQLGTGCRRRRIDGARTDRTSAIGAEVSTDDRERTWDMLANVGVPVPRNRREARDAAGSEHLVLVVDGRVVAAVEAGTGADRTRDLHADDAAVCAFAADVVGLDVAQLTVVASTLALPFRESGATIVDVVVPRDLAAFGHGRAAAAIVDALFPAGTPSHVPVVAVTGTNGKTTTTRLVAHLLRQAGHRVGFTTTDGVYAGDAMVFEGDMTGPMAADIVLSNPRIDAAVLETARGGILRAGLGYDACDVGVVLNVTADHLGLRGIHTVEQLAEVKAVIVSAVREGGHAVLNADDPLVLAMRRGTGARVVLFSLEPAATHAPVAAHLGAGGMAVTLERVGDAEALVLHRGAGRTVLAALGQVPLAEGGAARFQVQNAAAACAAAWALGVAPEALRAGLATFVPSAAMTPGRMNVVRVRDATVIVDYAHNPAAIRALLDYAARVDAGRRLAVLHTPGDRRDDDIREMGTLGAGLDAVVFMESPDYRRGRRPGESGALLVEGFVAAGGDAARTVVVEGQEAAVDEVLRRLQPRDLVLFIADDARLVIDRLEAGARGGSPASGDA